MFQFHLVQCILCIQYRVGGDPQLRGGYLEYCEGCSVSWTDIMINMGDTINTVGMLSTSTFFMFRTEVDTRMQVWGMFSTLTFFMISPTVLKIPPAFLKISPMVLNTLHGTDHLHSGEHTGWF